MNLLRNPCTCLLFAIFFLTLSSHASPNPPSTTDLLPELLLKTDEDVVKPSFSFVKGVWKKITRPFRPSNDDGGATTEDKGSSATSTDSSTRSNPVRTIKQRFSFSRPLTTVEDILPEDTYFIEVKRKAESYKAISGTLEENTPLARMLQLQRISGVKYGELTLFSQMDLGKILVHIRTFDAKMAEGRLTRSKVTAAESLSLTLTLLPLANVNWRITVLQERLWLLQELMSKGQRDSNISEYGATNGLGGAIKTIEEAVDELSNVYCGLALQVESRMKLVVGLQGSFDKLERQNARRARWGLGKDPAKLRIGLETVDSAFIKEAQDIMKQKKPSYGFKFNVAPSFQQG